MTQFIAEVSSNHARDLERAKAFIDAAAAIGCDAVKFQLFRIAEMFAPEILARSERHRARAEWELPEAHIAPLAEHARARGIAFACTPFHLDAVAALRPHVAFFKIASYELLWTPLLEACAAAGRPVILSTGMATLEEILSAERTLTRAGATDVTLLHCVSAYPAPRHDCNLAAIETIRTVTGRPVGWSDHSRDPAVVLRAALHWRAAAIEFHLDLDGAGAEYEAGHCWLPDEIAPVIAAVRAGEEADGSGLKRPTPAELPDRDWRADPADGLRPLAHLRKVWRAA